MRTLTDTANLTEKQSIAVGNIYILFAEAAKSPLLPEEFKRRLSKLMNSHVHDAWHGQNRKIADTLSVALADVASYDARWAYGTINEQARRRFSRSLTRILSHYKDSAAI